MRDVSSALFVGPCERRPQPKALDRRYHHTTDIDCIFGWNEQERERSMQQHYAGLDLASRIERLARVTMMV